MNATAKDPPVVIIVPSTIAVLIDKLTERWARVFGESAENTRRAVEIAILSRGSAAIQEELKAEETLEAAKGEPTE